MTSSASFYLSLVLWSILLQTSLACDCHHKTPNDIPFCSRPKLTPKPAEGNSSSSTESTTTESNTTAGTTGYNGNSTTTEFTTTSLSSTTTMSPDNSSATCCRNRITDQIQCCRSPDQCEDACQRNNTSCESLARNGSSTVGLGCHSGPENSSKCSSCIKYLKPIKDGDLQQCVDDCNTDSIQLFLYNSDMEHSDQQWYAKCVKTDRWHINLYLIVIIPPAVLVTIILIIGIICCCKRYRGQEDTDGVENPLPAKEDLEPNRQYQKSKKQKGPIRALSRPNQYASELKGSQKKQIRSDSDEEEAYENTGYPPEEPAIANISSVSEDTVNEPETEYTDMSGPSQTQQVTLHPTEHAAEFRKHTERMVLPKGRAEPKPTPQLKPATAPKPTKGPRTYTVPETEQEKITVEDGDAIYQNNSPQTEHPANDLVSRLNRIVTQRRRQTGESVSKGPPPPSRDPIEEGGEIIYDELADDLDDRQPSHHVQQYVPEPEEAYADQARTASFSEELDYTAPCDAIASASHSLLNYEQPAGYQPVSHQAFIPQPGSIHEVEYTAPDNYDEEEVENVYQNV